MVDAEALVDAAGLGRVMNLEALSVQATSEAERRDDFANER
ncbi:MAG: hypothetical protein ACRDZU_14740 [Acidimicrobiales bacterium]